MGQKVNPHGLRVGVIKDWDSKWYAEETFADNLVEDYNIRKFLKNKLYAAGISKIETERASDRLKIVIHTAKPGIVIGKGGAEIENLKKQVEKLLKSAAANAENNNGMDPSKLYVEECYANKGPTMKRIRPRAQGRAYRIEKRMSHITLVLDER